MSKNGTEDAIRSQRTEFRVKVDSTYIIEKLRKAFQEQKMKLNIKFPELETLINKMGAKKLYGNLELSMKKLLFKNCYQLKGRCKIRGHKNG